MDRLPIKFEEEVLAPAEIIWREFIDHDTDNGSVEFYSSKIEMKGCFGNNENIYYKTSYHDIASRGLEAMQEKDHSLMIEACSYNIERYRIGKYYAETIIEICRDKDFRECIFKAIRKIYETK